MMTKKLFRIWFANLALLMLTSAWLTAAPVGASVQGVRYDPSNNTAWISLANNSKKFITGFSLALRFVYVDGPKDHGHFIEDFPGKADSKQEELGAAWSGEGTIRPGEVRDVEYAVPPATTANPILRIEATVAAVAYSDRTADARDGKAFESLVSIRKERYLAYRDTAQILRKALSHEDDPNPLRSALTELEQLRDRCKAGRTEDSCVHLEGAVQNLGQYFTTQWERPLSQRDFLNDFATRFEHAAAQALPHTQLWRQK